MSVTETTKKEKIDADELEIRLSDIVRFVKASRWRVLLGALLGLVIGAIYAFSKPDQYTVQATVIPEIQSKGAGLSGLSSLAGLAGIDISAAAAGSGSIDAIRPDIYPDVLEGVPFALQLLRQPVYSTLFGKVTPLQTFIEEQNRQSLLGRLVSSDNGLAESALPDPKNLSKTLQITKEQEKLIAVVHNAVSVTIDKKTGIITVGATFPDPVVAATVARLSLEYLTDYITTYRTERLRNQVRFLSGQVNDAKSRYQKAEYAVSVYRDRNRSIYLETAKIEEQRLQADYMLTQTVFGELSKQLEQAKVKVAEESPVFKTLEPARIPNKKSGPSRGLILLGFGVAGCFVALVFYGLRQLTLTLEN